MNSLQITALVIMGIGAFINYGARLFVNRLGLTEKIKTKEAEEFSGEELMKYKMTKAIARVKIIGLLVMLPGVILVFIAFR